MSSNEELALKRRIKTLYKELKPALRDMGFSTNQWNKDDASGLLIRNEKMYWLNIPSSTSELNLKSEDGTMIAEYRTDIEDFLTQIRDL